MGGTRGVAWANISLWSQMASKLMKWGRPTGESIEGVFGPPTTSVHSLHFFPAGKMHEKKRVPRDLSDSREPPRAASCQQAGGGAVTDWGANGGVKYGRVLGGGAKDGSWKWMRAMPRSQSNIIYGPAAKWDGYFPRQMSPMWPIAASLSTPVVNCPRMVDILSQR